MLRTITTAAALCASLATSALAQEVPTLGTAESERFGTYVTGPSGLPVYAFVTDEMAGDNLTPLVSCGDPCREIWPLVTVAQQSLGVSEGMDADLAATIVREDAYVAVYNSTVLWYYVRDELDVEPQGHAISTYGGWWYLIGPDGETLDRDPR